MVEPEPAKKYRLRLRNTGLDDVHDDSLPCLDDGHEDTLSCLDDGHDESLSCLDDGHDE